MTSTRLDVDADLGALSRATVVVTGAGVSGMAAVRALRFLGARVLLVDNSETSLQAGQALGAEPVRMPGDGADDPDFARVIGAADLIVTSPGWRPDSPILAVAIGNGVPVWGDVELAWRLDAAEVFGKPRRWLAVTGTNGKTTTTTMLQSILEAAGVASAACGNIGYPLLDALIAGTANAEPRVEVFAAELSSFQLHWAPSVRPEAGVVLNIAEDHLDWHGDMDAYAQAKAQVLTGRVGVVGLDDALASRLGARSQAQRTVGFRLGEPEQGELGIVDGNLVDRAFTQDGADAVLLPAAQVRPGGPPGLLDALAAAALARAIGVSPEQVAAGLRAHEPGAHRNLLVAEHGGVRFFDDSKATNPHAARASLLAHDRVVWVAGGQLKGATVDELVVELRGRLVAAVLIGVDRELIAAALARHAPDVPVTRVVAGDDGGVVVIDARGTEKTIPGGSTPDAVMVAAVTAAAGYAQPGDTVLLAPAAASLDMFTSYGHRGTSFAAAAEALT